MNLWRSKRRIVFVVLLHEPLVRRQYNLLHPFYCLPSSVRHIPQSVHHCLPLCIVGYLGLQGVNAESLEFQIYGKNLCYT